MAKNDENDEKTENPEAAESKDETTESALPSQDETDLSPDDLLDDIRKSLIEEESEKSHQDSKWWRRFGRKGKTNEPEPPPPSLEIDLPALEDSVQPLDVHEGEQLDEYEDSIDELLESLESESRESALEQTVAPAADVQPEPEPEVDFEALKEQAFRPRTPDEESESLSDVRSIALEDGEEVFVEVQAPVVDPMAERVNAFENALKPYRRYIYGALAILGVGIAVVASLILFNVYQQYRPQPATQPSNVPYPTSVSLPGGWSFQLGKGSLQAGRWDPQGPEWLEGTEICRWVALPWSRQLEAVVRTLNSKDPVELVMSNNDKLTYGVYSIRELTMEEIQAQDSNSPCMLLILTQSESEKHWVVTALP